jgi:hypothetical protein
MRLGSGVLAIALLALGADAAQAGVFGKRSGILDEFNVDVYRGAETARVAGGLTFGDVFDTGFWWFYGGRAAWTQYLDDAPKVTGWALGGTIGVGCRPDRTVSPVAGLNLEKPFGTDDRISYQTQVYAGARIRLGSAPEHFAFTFAVYRAAIQGSSGFGDKSDTGLAILYSASRLASR